ncbi:MAG: hypothetical protein JW991_03370 [Candidatus Pacebacteria bacterium]|nr:hypothetical protein [Candidatus Paceibacterota bacterium]
MIKLNFTIDQNYFISHLLAGMAKNRFSSFSHKKDIVSFQNYAWKKSATNYNLLISRFSPETWLKMEIARLSSELNKYLETLKKSNYYQTLLVQTRNYQKDCQRQWEENYFQTQAIMKNLTGIRFNKQFTVFITHPGLKNGCYLGNNQIAWGHNEDWPNYTTVYLWHEILHSYFSDSQLNHAIISLLTDEELRARLNRSKYPPFAIHRNLNPLIKKLLPEWKKYLKSEKKNINLFMKEAKDYV